MKFQVLDILPHLKNPVTGRLVRTDERFAQALTSARYAEEFGLDAAAGRAPCRGIPLGRLGGAPGGDRCDHEPGPDPDRGLGAVD